MPIVRATGDKTRSPRPTCRSRSRSTAGRSADRPSQRERVVLGAGEFATECMESTGIPTSTVGMPSRVAVNGPMVEPQGTALFDTNSWVGHAGARGRPAARSRYRGRRSRTAGSR